MLNMEEEREKEWEREGEKSKGHFLQIGYNIEFESFKNEANFSAFSNQ